MILIFEGFDKSGKTTLAKKISEKYNFSYFKPTKQINSSINLEESIKHDWRILLDLFSQININIIIDRSFISQWVYSIILRKDLIKKQYGNLEEYNKIFENYCNELNKINSLIIFCKRKNYDNENDEHVNVKDNKLFNFVYDDFFKMFKIKNILKCDFENGIEDNFLKIERKLNNE